MNFHSATTPSTISITWVATSPVEAERQPIGKVWALKGKWPVTAGVKRTSYFLEPVVYENLDEATDDVAQRIRVGKWTMVTGAPRGGLDLTKLHARSSDNFVDAPTTLFIADFDGFTADPGEDLSKPEHFGDPIASALRTRLTAAGVHSLAEATFVLTATASTGFDPTSKGEPAYGCARFRLIFETTTPLTLAQQGGIAEAIGRLPGFGTLNADGKPSPEPCIDTNIYPPAYNIFTDRPILPAGVEDPIEHPVWTFDGDEGHERVDPVELMRELGLGELPGDGLDDSPPPPKDPPTDNHRLLEVEPELRIPLVRQAVAAIHNDLSREDWVWMAHAIDGALGGDPEAKTIFLDFSARRDGYSDPAEDKRVWETRGEGRAGIGRLMKLLETQKTPEAEAVRTEIRFEQARATFSVLPDEEISETEGADADRDDDDALLARRAPAIDPRAFYGPLARLVVETTRASEATKVGVAAQIMAHTSLTMRPFYDALGDRKLPFNLYIIQLGLSGRGRKGTSAAIADGYYGPALQRLAREEAGRLLFTDEDGLARAAAETAVAETKRKLEWTENVQPGWDLRPTADRDTLRSELADLETAIAERKARLRRRAPALRTVREYERLIAEDEAKRVNVAEVLAAAEAELEAVQQVLEDPAAARAKARSDHGVALSTLAATPSPAAPEPWRALFASLADGPVTAAGISSGEGLLELIRDAGQRTGPRGPIHDPGVANKCLFANFDEFGNTLAVITRPGSTLSPILKTMWDCTRTEMINKTSPLRVAEPYLTISASITPAEFVGRVFDRRDVSSSADNGLGNRLFLLWVLRDKLVAHPKATQDLTDMMDELARNVFRVYEALKPEGAFLSTPILWSPEAMRAGSRNTSASRTARLQAPTPVSSGSADRPIRGKSRRSWR